MLDLNFEEIIFKNKRDHIDFVTSSYCCIFMGRDKTVDGQLSWDEALDIQAGSLQY